MPDFTRIILDPPAEAIAALDAARGPNSPLQWIASLHETAERLRAPGPTADLASGLVEDHWDREWAEAALFEEPARTLAAQSPDSPRQPRSYTAGPWRLVVAAQPSGDLQLTLHGRGPVILTTTHGTLRLRPGKAATLPAAELPLPPRIRLPDGRQLTLE